MRHMLMGSMHGGMAGFMLFGLVRRMAMRLVMLGLVVAVVVLWVRLRQERRARW